MLDLVLKLKHVTVYMTLPPGLATPCSFQRGARGGWRENRSKQASLFYLSDYCSYCGLQGECCSQTRCYLRNTSSGLARGFLLPTHTLRAGLAIEQGEQWEATPAGVQGALPGEASSARLSCLLCAGPRRQCRSAGASPLWV